MIEPLFPAWTASIGFIIGAFVGSFLNMVIYRLPRGLSFGQPKRSFCPICKHSLDWIDLMPIVSWLRTKGKCNYCHAPIAVRYLIVELLTGAIFAGVWLTSISVNPDPLVGKAVVMSLAGSLLVTIIFIDWELYIIPDELNALLLVLGLIYAGFTGPIKVALLGAFLGWALLWGIAFLGRVVFGKDAMGHGDIKMMRGVGAIIGPLLLLADLGIAVILGLIVGLSLMAFTRKAGASQPEVSAEIEEDEDLGPESIGSLLKMGAWYLLCLDCIAIFAPKMYNWIGEDPTETFEEVENWTPSATTIPFGPYLAAGAILCILFEAPIEKGMKDYWQHQTGSAESIGALDLGRNYWGIRSRSVMASDAWTWNGRIFTGTISDRVKSCGVGRKGLEV